MPLNPSWVTAAIDNSADIHATTSDTIKYRVREPARNHPVKTTGNNWVYTPAVGQRLKVKEQGLDEVVPRATPPTLIEAISL